MALTDKLTAIADAIRGKTGNTDKLTLDAMPAEIAGITTAQADIFVPEDIPDYVKTEATAVASKVRSVVKDDSIICIAMSDNHYNATQENSDTQNITGGQHAAMALKVLAYMINPDFIAHLGDVSWGNSTTSPDQLKTQIETFNGFLAEGVSGYPYFGAIGNHDSGIYYHQSKADGTVYTMSGDYLFQQFTAKSASDNTVFAGEEYGGYCYRDFPDKKLRVFLLNTSEQLVSKQYDAGTLPAQQLWVANALHDLGSKSDAAEWGFIVLCHYPVDYGDARPISNVFKAYVNGESITVNGSAVSFSGCNGARFLAQFHGHTHCFKTARLNGYNSSGTMYEYDAYRVAIPNGQYNRENYYTNPYYGIYFCEDTSYPKTPNTAQDTAFVVNVINPSEQMIYSYCYGAGYDRAVSIAGIVYYSIHTDLTGASMESSATTVKEGDAYTGTIVVTEGYELDSVVVTMGGVDITSQVYADGVITIPEVTGTVSITVTTKAPAVNLLPLAIDTDGSLYNGGLGYKSGYYISSSGSGEKVSTNGYISGFIPYSSTDTLVLYNIGNEIFDYHEPMLIGFRALDSTKTHGDVNLRTEATINDDGSITVTPDMFALDNANMIQYVRLSCSYIGSDSEVYKE